MCIDQIEIEARGNDAPYHALGRLIEEQRSQDHADLWDDGIAWMEHINAVSGLLAGHPGEIRIAPKGLAVHRKPRNRRDDAGVDLPAGDQVPQPVLDEDAVMFLDRVGVKGRVGENLYSGGSCHPVSTSAITACECASCPTTG